jgi:tRNA threonylcarbamoyladenosine biosynthesis protein TsaB
VTAGAVLAFDASTTRSTVAVVREGLVVATGEARGRDPREERLLPLILSVCAQAGVALGDVGTIAVGAGPGSFTGLRVAAATAKGIAAATGALLVPVSSLVLIVAGLPEMPPCGRYLATLDALRGERYVALVSVDAAGIGLASAGEASRRIPESVLAQVAEEMDAEIIGPGTAWDAWPHAQGIARAALPAPADLASWEPDYGRASAAEDRRRAQ